MSLLRRKQREPRIWEVEELPPHMRYIYWALVGIVDASGGSVSVKNFKQWIGRTPEVTIRHESDGSLTVMLVREEHRDQ